MKKYFIPGLAIVVIGGLEALALCKGIDGIAFSGTVAIIAGIAGYVVKDKVIKSGGN